jgi:hypothetical protein
MYCVLAASVVPAEAVMVRDEAGAGFDDSSIPLLVGAEHVVPPKLHVAPGHATATRPVSPAGIPPDVTTAIPLVPVWNAKAVAPLGEQPNPIQPFAGWLTKPTSVVQFDVTSAAAPGTVTLGKV